MAAEAALGRWARSEMQLPPGAAPGAAALRRLCAGPGAAIWEFVTRHVRHPRNVEKIRGNLRWYRGLQQPQGAGPAGPGAELRGVVTRLRQEVGGVGGALGGAQEAALELEAALGAGLSRRGAELRRGLELRLLGEAAAGEGQRLRRGREALRPPPGPEGAGLEVAAAGMEPEVLAAVRGLCRRRSQELEELLEPRPLGGPRPPTLSWLREAEAVLSRHPPAAVLGALGQLAGEGSAPPPPRKGEPDPDLDLDPEVDPDLDPEAPPTVQSLIEERWGQLGGLWGHLPPLATRLRPLGARLGRLGQRLRRRLGGDPESLRAARLALAAAGLAGARGALARGVQALRGRGGPPTPQLKELRERLRRGRCRLARRQRHLRALAAAAGTLRARVRPLQEQVRGAGRVPPALAGEGERLRQLLGALGALGALGRPPPSPPPDPLLPACRALGVPPYKGPQGALCRAASLRQELRGRGRGAGPSEEGAEPPELLPLPGGGAEAELLPRLRLVAAQSRRRIEAWPRLLALVIQWWEQPAQWVLAPPPGAVPFSHWLQRWAGAAQALGWPRPLPLAPPPRGGEGRGQEKPRP